MSRPIERETWQALRSLVVDHNDRKREVCDALGMSFVRIKALRQIAAGPTPMRELAASLATDASYTTLVVDDLVNRGLVVRAANPDDRRAKIVSVTAPGRRAARKAESILAMPPDAMRRLSDEDLVQLRRIVSALIS